MPESVTLVSKPSSVSRLVSALSDASPASVETKTAPLLPEAPQRHLKLSTDPASVEQ
jgi:hypothetical protein